MTKRIIAAACTMAATIGVVAAVSFANPNPPTNGGNGAGRSGQCTGAASARPASCQSSK